jgi:SAM-dependent methyltransferase
MERFTYYQLAEIEDGHWWFVYRRKLVAQLIQSLDGISGEAALDIGCGTGGNLPLLKTYCANAIGIDLSEDAIALARKKFPEDTFLKGDINELRNLYPAESFDLVSDFSVLHHQWVSSDFHSMCDIHRLLRTGGFFVLTEPAFAFLRRANDRLGLGPRRYTLVQLKGLLEKAGFRDVRGTYFNVPAFPIASMLALVERLGLSSGKHDDRIPELRLPPRWLNNALVRVLLIELVAIHAFGRMPFGVSIACVARKS